MLNLMLKIFSHPKNYRMSIVVKRVHFHIPFFMNKDGYTAQAVPLLAQVSPCTDIGVLDVDQDGWLDLLLLGNDFYPEADIGRQASNYVQVLKNKGDHTFSYWMPYQHGLYNNLEHRKLTSFVNALTQKQNFIFTNRNEKPILFQLK